MNETTQRPQNGFTVLEALISMLLFLAVLTSVLGVYTPSKLIYARGEAKTDVQQNARLAMTEIARDIRLAGYFPENFGDSPPSPALETAILIATDDFLAIHGDADGSAASNVFSFCLDGTRLRRGKAATDDEDAYGCNGIVLAENVSSLRFTYYDENGDPLPDPPSTPYALDDQAPGSVPDLDDTAERDSVRRVVVTLTSEADTPQGGHQIYHLTSDAWLRNSG